jgi:hypothetical protein
MSILRPFAKRGNLGEAIMATTPSAAPPVQDVKEQVRSEDLRLPLPVKYLSESEIIVMLGTTKRAFRQRPESARPPCIALTPRKRIYDPAEFAAWIASLPRSK